MLKRILYLGSVLLLGTAGLTYGQTGTVQGTVVDAEDDSPLPGVNVLLEGTTTGASTNVDGAFSIEVPAGEHTLIARFVGYETSSREIAVSAGETVDVEFRLQQGALGLEEIVVTGTAGEARKRELGHTIDQVDAEDVVSPPTDFSSLVQGRVSGVSILSSGGSIGAGSQIRLRGNVSVSQSNQPIVYVDGMRMRSDGYPRNQADLIGQDLRGVNSAASPIGDINPADVDRIEIIKGAAAATLYGSEAASGVVQIFTKKGTPADGAQWTLRIDNGVDWIQKFGAADAPYLNMKPWLRPAHQQNYYLSVGGGDEDVRYFISGDYKNNKGVMPNDYQDKWSFRGNVNFQATDNLDITWTNFYTRNSLQNTPTGNNAQSVTYNAFTHPGGFLPLDKLDETLSWEATTDIDHLLTGAAFTYTVGSNLVNKLTAGYDLINLEHVNLRPFGFISAPQGVIEVQRWRNQIFSLDYRSTLETELTGGLQSDLSWGGQFIDTRRSDITAASQNFPGPGKATVASGAEQLSSGSRLRVITGGVFMQEVLGYEDKLFLTLGARLDGNSAFGEDFGLQFYPKVSASYVISDEDFWPDSWGQVQLRAAYGEAGRAPGAFDAVRTWDPIGWGGESALVPNQVGNPNLGPERTKEIEAGFESSFLGDRAQLAFTYYRQTTVDALMPVRQVPSEGFVGTQLENVGKMRNVGIEASLDGILIEGEKVNWELGISLSTNHSKVLDLGKAVPFQLAGRGQGWIIEGQPLPVIRGGTVVNPDENAEPVIETINHGPNLPTHTIGINTRVLLPGEVTVAAVAEYMGGHYIDNQAFRSMAQREAVPQCRSKGGYDGQLGELPAFWRAWCNPTNLPNENALIVPADNFRVRSITLSAPIPFSLPRVDDAVISLSLRNAFKWINDDVMFLDPEMAGQEGVNSFPRVIVEQVPPPASFTASLKARF